MLCLGRCCHFLFQKRKKLHYTKACPGFFHQGQIKFLGRTPPPRAYFTKRGGGRKNLIIPKERLVLVSKKYAQNESFFHQHTLETYFFKISSGVYTPLCLMARHASGRFFKLTVAHISQNKLFKNKIILICEFLNLSYL